MSAGIVMIAGMASVCSSLCSASSFYACTDGTLEMNNFSANTCTAFFSSSSNCLTIDTQDACDAEDACQWDDSTCKRVKDIVPPEDPKGVDARYVKLFHDISSNIINVAEIEVYDYEGTKLTSNTTVIEGYSTQHDVHAWSNIFDGNLTTFGHSQDTDVNQFVNIDLGSKKKIYKVVVENRRDCCKDRIQGARIELHDGTNPIISTPRITSASNTYTYKFDTNSVGWTRSPT